MTTFPTVRRAGTRTVGDGWLYEKQNAVSNIRLIHLKSITFAEMGNYLKEYVTMIRKKKREKGKQISNPSVGIGAYSKSSTSRGQTPASITA